MGKRYVEVFEAKRSEMEWACKRAGASSDENDNRVVRLRGLPYGCSKEEVANFFKGMKKNSERFLLVLTNQCNQSHCRILAFPLHRINKVAKWKIG